ncbi:glycoside hydrolase [Qipengyuania sp. JC766]|uniref:glycoside hydrolase n=1 Tax=Qipengyuania sp. JC766 TaxID=3232139 RepID=UPI0034599132
MVLRRFAILAAFGFSAACAADPLPPPPAALGLDPFYQKHLDADGIPVVSSTRVSDEALRRTHRIMEAMLAHRPELASTLKDLGYRVAIMAEDEGTLDLPEQAHWTKPGPDDPRLTRCERKHYEARIGSRSHADYWNSRARGMAGQLTSGAVEDIMGMPSSRYWGETIFVHEFSHGILAAIQVADPALFARIEAAYAGARDRDLWAGEYAMTNMDEYWAEGTQFWFNSNRLAVMDGRRVLNHEDLAAYDPALFAVLAEAYGEAHELPGDPFYRHAARVPPGPPPQNTAEVC